MTCSRTLYAAAPAAVAGLLAIVGAAGCCYTPAPAPAPALAPPVAAPVAPVAPGAASASTSLTLAAGFVPDPSIVFTLAGGPTPASTMAVGDVWCAGYIGTAPNVTLTTTTPIYGMRILTRSDVDTTLAVRLSDGRVLCNDDGGGYPNPAVDVFDLPAGVHQIYVGTFGGGTAVPATVGFTTNALYMNGSLP